MSFKQTYSDVTICNMTLSRIKQAPINSLNPPAPAGASSRACSQWYKPVVAKLLETHHWGLASSRVDLVEVVSERSTDGWSYAYERPTDMAFPVRPVNLGGSGLRYYQGLGGLIAMLSGQAIFLVAGQRIYSKAPISEIDYVSYNVTEADFNATFVDIIVKSLASQIAYEITGQKKLADDMNEEAINAMNVAIAQNLNAGSPRYGDNFISEADRARGAGFAPHAWDWNYSVYPQ